VLERLRDERAEWEAIEGGKPDYGDQVEVEITPLAEGEEGAAHLPLRDRRGTGDPGHRGGDPHPRRGRRGRVRRRLPGGLPGRGAPGRDAQAPDPAARRGAQEARGSRRRVRECRRRLREPRRAPDPGPIRSRRTWSSAATAEVRRQLVEQIIEANPFEVPGSMVDRYLDYMTGHSHEGHEKQRPRARGGGAPRQGPREPAPPGGVGLKRMMVVERIAEQEGLSATQDEIDAKVEELAARTSAPPARSGFSWKRTASSRCSNARSPRTRSSRISWSRTRSPEPGGTRLAVPGLTSYRHDAARLADPHVTRRERARCRFMHRT
jgi:trigger factor